MHLQEEEKIRNRPAFGNLRLINLIIPTILPTILIKIRHNPHLPQQSSNPLLNGQAPLRHLINPKIKEIHLKNLIVSAQTNKLSRVQTGLGVEEKTGREKILWTLYEDDHQL